MTNDNVNNLLGCIGVIGTLVPIAVCVVVGVIANELIKRVK